MRSFVSLGSNLNNPRLQLANALERIQRIPSTRLIEVSSLYLTAPIGKEEQPDFYNQVVEIETTLSPHALLVALQSVEHALGRVRTEHWGPRVIDCDILLYGDLCIQTDTLTVPHLHMTRRAFVLYPLAEISPGLVLPCGQTVQDLCVAVSSQYVVKCEK